MVKLMERRGISALVVVGVILGILGMIALGAFSWYSGHYNTLSRMDEDCNEGWAQIENVYQRRFDLIPRLVNSTKMYINYESSTLIEISEARSQWGKALASGDQSEMEDASTGIERVMGRLLMITSIESYPELKGDTLVMGLIDELTGTENRLSVERMRYNEKVGVYNTYRRDMLVEMILGAKFPARTYFEIRDEAWEAPNVPI